MKITNLVYVSDYCCLVNIDGNLMFICFENVLEMNSKFEEWFSDIDSRNYCYWSSITLSEVKRLADLTDVSQGEW
jgi:hypothetical protein